MTMLACFGIVIVLTLAALAIALLVRIFNLVTRPFCPVCNGQDLDVAPTVALCRTCGVHHISAPTWRHRIVVALGYLITFSLSCVILVPLSLVLSWLVPKTLT